MKTRTRFGWLEDELELLKQKHLYRRLRVLEDLKSTRARVGGRPIVLFSGNDYLGLTRHPKVIEAAGEALARYGAGAGSARLISGTSGLHAKLEERIAQFEGKERALVFSTGYMANVGTISGLAGPCDLVMMDKLSHASLIDGAKLSGAQIRIYPHSNLDYLEKLLARAGARRKWIVTDAVFSMDGDLAPLPELVRLKDRYGAYLIIDEAHGTGVFGSNGRGAAEHFGVESEIDVHIGTLSKAIGALGGFVAGSRELIEGLVNRARAFIFATALPPAVCAAALEAFNVIENEPGLRARLFANAKRLRERLKQASGNVLGGESPIIPMMLGEAEEALKAAEFLFEQGFLVPAVRYPTVPKHKARLRFTVSALHQSSEIDALAAAFKTLRQPNFDVS